MLELIALTAAPQDGRLRFHFLDLFMPTNVPAWFESLPDVPSNEKWVDSIAGGSDDAGELQREERGGSRRRGRYWRRWTRTFGHLVYGMC